MSNSRHWMSLKVLLRTVNYLKSSWNQKMKKRRVKPKKRRDIKLPIKINICILCLMSMLNRCSNYNSQTKEYWWFRRTMLGGANWRRLSCNWGRLIIMQDQHLAILGVTPEQCVLMIIRGSVRILNRTLSSIDHAWASREHQQLLLMSRRELQR